MLESLIQRFLNYLALERRASAHTVSSYERVLTKFTKTVCQELPYLVEDGRADLGRLGLKEMRIVQKSFNFFDEGSGKLNNNSVAHDLYALSSFFSYLVRQGEISSNPVKLLKVPAVKRHLPKVLTLNEVEKLLSYKPETVAEYRDSAIAELLFGSGLRVSEAASLDLGRLDLAAMEVRVLGKGGKERIVPFNESARMKLEDYLSRRSSLIPQDDAVFLNLRGGRISTRAIQQNLDILARKAGLSTHVHPHKLRHSFATGLLQGGADLRVVQEMLGHASLAATEIYTHLDFKHLKKVYENAHPLAKEDGHDKKDDGSGGIDGQS